MIRRNPIGQYRSRLKSELLRLGNVKEQLGKRPTIFRLWLLSSLLWLMCSAAFISFAYIYHGQQWVSDAKLWIIIGVLIGFVLCLVCPMIWRVFVIIDGQEKTMSDFKRTEYSRETPVQKQLNEFASYLRKKYKLSFLNRRYIIAVHGSPEAFTDVGGQLARTGWVRVDNVYLVLLNDIDDVSAVPNFRGKHQSPFDGIVILRDLNDDSSATTIDSASDWLDKVYQLVNWQIPFVHVSQSQLALTKLPFTQVFAWRQKLDKHAEHLKAKTYRFFLAAFLKSQDRQFLSLQDEVERADLAPDFKYNAAQTKWCVGIGVQAKQSNWWETWAVLATQFKKLSAMRIQTPLISVFAKIVLFCCALVMSFTVFSFSVNYREVQTLQAQITAVKQAKQTTQALQAILDLQRSIAELQNMTKPLYAKLGFNHKPVLLDKALVVYGGATKRWLVEPADSQVVVVLKSLQNVDTSKISSRSADALGLDPLATELVLTQGYEALKAYLMLRDSKRVDSAFLSDYLMQLYRLQSPKNAETAQTILQFYARNLPQNATWLLTKDDVLVSQSRYVLNAWVNAQQQDVEIYQKLLAQAQGRFAPINLPQLVGSEVNEFWNNPRYLSGVFTAQAWEQWFKPELKKIKPEFFPSGSWVLRDDNLDNSELDIHAKIMELYRKDYFKAWYEFLSGIQWVEFKSVPKQMDRLKKYADKTNSPLVKLLAAIQSNTQIGFERDRTDGGKGVLLEFEPLVQMLKATEDPNKKMIRDIDLYQENLLAMYLEVQKIQQSTNPAAASQLSFDTLLSGGEDSNLGRAERAIELQVANIGDVWQEVGRTLLSYPFKNSKQIILGPALVNINDLWQQTVVSQWNQRFANKYPLNGGSKNDVSLAELQKFVDPERGVVAQFNRQYLNNILVLVGNQWQVKPIIGDQIRVDSNFLTKLNEMNQVLEFVTNKDPQASVELKFLPIPDMRQIRLLSNTQAFDFYNEQSYWRKILWPIDEDTEKKITLQWIAVDAKTGMLELTGDLALLRLLDQATARQNDDTTYRLKWKINERIVEMDLKNLQTNDFISVLKLKSFNFPQQVFIANDNAQ